MSDADDEPAPTPPAAFEDDDVRDLLKRLGRPHRSGGTVVERAALAAAGVDFDVVMQWITEHGGEAEVPKVKARRQAGLHAARDAPQVTEPLRFVLPPDAL